jgi:hypothetical protein
MRLLITQNPKLKTQHFILGFLLVFCLFSSPCFAQGLLTRPIERLPSLPNLPSGEKEYAVGGTISGSLEKELDLDKLDSVSRPIDAKGELKTDTDGVKTNKYKIGYYGSTGRIESRIEKNRGTEQENIDTQGELKKGADGVVKANKYNIGYYGSTGRIESRIEKNRGTEQEDLEASKFPGQTLRLPDTQKFGFQYRSPLLGRIGLDAGAGNANNQAEN